MIGLFKGYMELYKETESVEPGMVVYSYDAIRRPKQDSFQYHKSLGYMERVPGHSKTLLQTNTHSCRNLLQCLNIHLAVHPTHNILLW